MIYISSCMYMSLEKSTRSILWASETHSSKTQECAKCCITKILWDTPYFEFIVGEFDGSYHL